MEDSKADRIISLLEEIKNLQQQSIDNYSRALRNQEESIALQKMATNRFRNFLFPAILVAVILIIIAILLVMKITLRF